MDYNRTHKLKKNNLEGLKQTDLGAYYFYSHSITGIAKHSKGAEQPVDLPNTQGNWVAHSMYGDYMQNNLIVVRLTNMRVCKCQKLTLLLN